MYYCYLLQGDRFYLRLLLTVIPSANSFEHLHTVYNVIYKCYQQACVALGLLQDDQEWVQCFTEAITFVTGKPLRVLFATSILYGGVGNLEALWTQFGLHLSDALPHELQHLRIAIPLHLEGAHLD